MPMFRQITDTVYASPQIGVEEVAKAKTLGITLVINNRPEGESDDQTPGAEIARAAQEAGIDYVEIPVTHAGFAENQVVAMAEALERSAGPVLAYCRRHGAEQVTVLLNLGAEPQSLPAPQGAFALSTLGDAPDVADGRLALRGNEGVVYRVAG